MSHLELVKAAGLRGPEDFLSDLKLAEEEQQAEDQAKELHIEELHDTSSPRYINTTLEEYCIFDLFMTYHSFQHFFKTEGRILHKAK